MSGKREAVSTKKKISAAIFGIVSLFLLDFPFLSTLVGSYWFVNLSSGLELGVEGARSNLAQAISDALYNSGYWGRALPGSEFTLAPPFPSIWAIIAGGLMVEVLGLIAVVFPERRYAEIFGRLIEVGGVLIFLGSLFTIAAIMLTFPQGTVSGLVFLPGWAVFVELVLGLVLIKLGSRLMPTPPPIDSPRA